MAQGGRPQVASPSNLLLPGPIRIGGLMVDEGHEWSELENLIHDAAGPKVSWGVQKTVADAIREAFGGDEPSADMLAAIDDADKNTMMTRGQDVGGTTITLAHTTLLQAVFRRAADWRAANDFRTNASTPQRRGQQLPGITIVAGKVAIENRAIRGHDADGPVPAAAGGQRGLNHAEGGGCGAEGPLRVRASRTVCEGAPGKGGCRSQ